MFENFEKDFISRIKNNMNALTKEICTEINRNTPVDTGNLISNNKTIPAEIVGDKIVGKIENAVEYAWNVEYGVGGRKYNYHKNGVVFYTGVGARMFTRAFDTFRGKIIDKLTR